MPRRPRLARPLPLHPILLAAYPILFLWSQNLAEVTLADALPPLAQVTAATLALLTVLWLLLRNAARAAIIASALVVAFLTFGHAQRLLAPLRVGHPVQFGGSLLFVAIAVLFALRSTRSLAPATSGLNIVAGVLVAVTLVSIVPRELSRAGSERGVAAPTTSDAEAGPAAPRDIYYLVFDRYGSESSLRLRYGVDNDLPEWLVQQGFFVADRSHANYARTPLSLATSLNMRYLDDLTSRYGRETNDLTPVYGMIKDHSVGRLLKSRGYRYVHIGSWWEATRTSPIADVNLNVAGESEFSSVFYDSTMLPYLFGQAGKKRPTRREAHRASALYQFEQLDKLVSMPGPKFVFGHVLLPHPPLVFHADGSPITPAELRKTPAEELYREQLAFTNARIRRLVESLLSGPEASRPIVILQADEGPYLEDRKPSQEDAYRIRYGILNAFYLPDLQGAGPYPTITPVNAFRLLLSRYFGAHLPLLPDRSFSWPTVFAPHPKYDQRIYDFTEITHLLVTPSGSMPQSASTVPANRVRPRSSPRGNPQRARRAHRR